MDERAWAMVNIYSCIDRRNNMQHNHGRWSRLHIGAQHFVWGGCGPPPQLQKGRYVSYTYDDIWPRGGNFLHNTHTHILNVDDDETEIAVDRSKTRAGNMPFLSFLDPHLPLMRSAVAKSSLACTGIWQLQLRV